MILLSLDALFFQTMAQPEFTGDAAAFMAGLASASYFMPFLMFLQLLVGVSYLTNRYVALGALLIVPFWVHILLFHVFLAPSTILMGLIYSLLNLYIFWKNMPAYRGLFQARAS